MAWRPPFWRKVDVGASRTRPPIACSRGGAVFSGPVLASLVGPQGERWDEAAINEYDDFAAFRSIVDTETYRREVAPHRHAALADFRQLALVVDELLRRQHRADRHLPFRRLDQARCRHFRRAGLGAGSLGEADQQSEGGEGFWKSHLNTPIESWVAEEPFSGPTSSSLSRHGEAVASRSACWVRISDMWRAAVTTSSRWLRRSSASITMPRSGFLVGRLSTKRKRTPQGIAGDDGRLEAHLIPTQRGEGGLLVELQLGLQSFHQRQAEQAMADHGRKATRLGIGASTWSGW
jgi:hypothetical protein